MFHSSLKVLTMWRRALLDSASFYNLQSEVRSGYLSGPRSVCAKSDINGVLPSRSFITSTTTMAAPSTHEQGVTVLVDPPSCLHDESVSLRVNGLQPGQDVTLEASMVDTKGVKFLSYAHYKADTCGRVDVNTMESLGGSYKGIFPMGLISSLSPLLQKHKFTRFFKRDVENPNVVSLSVLKGHISKEELSSEERLDPPLSTTTHLRHYMAPGVKRIPVRYGRVRGCLFLPPGEGPFPGVVDMFGSAGGLLEYRSAQLASRGIASLALAFFAYDDLPKTMKEFDMTYFEEAVEFLLKHEKVTKPNVGAVGVSKGGDLVLSMSTFIPEVKAAVWINGCIGNVQSRLNLRDGSIPPLMFEIKDIKSVDGALDLSSVMFQPHDYPDTIIPIERADANFLFLASCDDKNWNSTMYADMAVERLRQAGKQNYTVYKYPEAGHLLEPPFSVYCYASYHKVVQAAILWGGKLKPHANAQIHAWDATLAFLYKHLRNDANMKGKL